MRSLVALFTCSLFALSAQAQRFDIVTKIGDVRYHEAANELAVAWQGDVWFQIDSNGHAPSCQTYGGKYVLVIPSGNEVAISMLLAAKMSGKNVNATFDDSLRFKGSSYCQLQYLTLVE